MFDHTDAGMDVTYFKLELILKILEEGNDEIVVPEDFNDQDLLNLMQDIVDLLDQPGEFSDKKESKVLAILFLLNGFLEFLRDDNNGGGNGNTGEAVLTLNFGDPLFLGAFTAGTINNFDLTVENTGDTPAENIEYKGLEPPYVFVGTTCDPVILPNNVQGVDRTCTVTLSYDPTVPSVDPLIDEDTFIITYDFDDDGDPNTPNVTAPELSKTIQASAL